MQGAQNIAKILLTALKMIDVIDKKQMYDSVITGKENASNDWNCIISIFVTRLNVYFVWFCMLCGFFLRSSWIFGEDSFRILVFSSLNTFSVSTSSRHSLFSSWKLTNVQNVYDCLYA